MVPFSLLPLNGMYELQLEFTKEDGVTAEMLRTATLVPEYHTRGDRGG